ncbi:hypothetical protein JRQ81_010958 [Phrynocephalus forsythii]|uniref:Uncharacterized protein n=1 Tax=Phrynocephalus forsythii TaxID=171643 RepID=A0A9Q0Y3R0_9SAUR|nr:hypothetical protein JRQ81_010958 [Phrynocephalus forsythii]
MGPSTHAPSSPSEPQHDLHVTPRTERQPQPLPLEFYGAGRFLASAVHGQTHPGARSVCLPAPWHLPEGEVEPPGREEPTMATASPSLRFKLILLGDFGVGKTTIFHRVRTGHFLEEAHTLGRHVSVCEKMVPLRHGRSSPQAQVSLWDTAGEERFLSLSSCYYRTNIFLLGNKSDLENRVPEEKAERFAAEHGASGRFKVSAKTGENVDRCLQEIVERLFLKKEVQCSSLHAPLQEAGYYSHCGC